MIKSKKAALGYRVFCLLFITFSLMKFLGIFQRRFASGSLMYYTLQSNILGLILFALLVCGMLFYPGRDFTRFEMICVVDLLVTFAVYWILLAPSFRSGLWEFDNLSVHFFSPLLCLADYALFAPKGRLKYADVYLVAVFPLFYVAFSTAAGQLGYIYYHSSEGAAVRYPYFFLDWDKLGVFALVYILAILVFFLILSHILYFADKKLSERGEP